MLVSWSGINFTKRFIFSRKKEVQVATQMFFFSENQFDFPYTLLSISPGTFIYALWILFLMCCNKCLSTVHCKAIQQSCMQRYQLTISTDLD